MTDEAGGTRLRNRARRGGVPVLVAVLAALAGCGESGGGGAGSDGGSSPSRSAPPTVPAPDLVPPNALPAGGCPVTIGDPAAAQQALDTARPGAQICLTGPGLAATTLRVTSSGTAAAPVRVLSDGAQVRGIDVRAGQVEVAGFTVRDGDGLQLRGAGLRAHHNNVLNAVGAGIDCECSGSVIESNVVHGTDGTGIRVEGDRITVRRNTVSGSVRREASDADGMRFFGTAIRITENTVRDISDEGYPDGDAPHTDCFQTYDSDAPPTFDVVLSGNRCERVGVQCLIATGKYGNPGVPAGVRSITFTGNYCAVGGSQAVNLDGYPHVVIRGNTITGPNLYRGIYLSSGATDAAVDDNVLIGEQPVYEADEESEPVDAVGNRNQR